LALVRLGLHIAALKKLRPSCARRPTREGHAVTGDDIKVPGERPKRFTVIWKGELVASFDTEEELNDGRLEYEYLIAVRAGKGCKPDDLRYEIRDGQKLLGIGYAREIV
jgi:hypothetical protein